MIRAFPVVTGPALACLVALPAGAQATTSSPSPEPLWAALGLGAVLETVRGAGYRLRDD